MEFPKTDNLFFCNVNIHRSTGTSSQREISAHYVRSMMMEKRNGGKKGEVEPKEITINNTVNDNVF